MEMINYAQHVDKIEASIRSQNPGQELEDLVLGLSAIGHSKKEITEFLMKYHLAQRETDAYLAMEKRLGDHPIELTMDRLWGWCNGKDRLLPNESLKA